MKSPSVSMFIRLTPTSSIPPSTTQASITSSGLPSSSVSELISTLKTVWSSVIDVTSTLLSSGIFVNLLQLDGTEKEGYFPLISVVNLALSIPGIPTKMYFLTLSTVQGNHINLMSVDTKKS